MIDYGYRSLRASACATALSSVLLPRGCGVAPAGYRRHQIVVLLRKSLVKAAHPKHLRVSGGGEREIPPGEDHQRDHKKSWWSRGPEN